MNQPQRVEMREHEEKGFQAKDAHTHTLAELTGAQHQQSVEKYKSA